MGYGGILNNAVGIGLDSDLGIKVYLLSNPRLEAKSSQAGTGQFWGEFIGHNGSQRVQENRWVNESKKR